MRLKITSKSGNFTLPPNLITPESNLSTLLSIIEAKINISKSKIDRLSLKYPTREILIRSTFEHFDKSLKTLEIKNGDILEVVLSGLVGSVVRGLEHEAGDELNLPENKKIKLDDKTEQTAYWAWVE